MSRYHAVSIITTFLCIVLVSGISAADGTLAVKKLVFDERRIEGKIRRPQLVLIKAEQRPEFEPMVLQDLGKTGNIAGSIDKWMLDRSPYDAAFKFRGSRIVNYIP